MFLWRPKRECNLRIKNFKGRQEISACTAKRRESKPKMDYKKNYLSATSVYLEDIFSEVFTHSIQDRFLSTGVGLCLILYEVELGS